MRPHYQTVRFFRRVGVFLGLKIHIVPASKLDPADYPQLDKTPPIDSPEVQQWIKDVQNSGVTIPDIAPTVPPGGCGGANAEAAADPSRCWWTCTGCLADDDVTFCPDKLTWGLTYDDGPDEWTGDLLSYLDSVDLKTTFFIVGSRAISYPAILQEEYMAEHQLGVHTWSHPYMTTLSNEQIIAELGWTKEVIKNATGVTPTFWRPPFGDVDNRVRAIATAMGLRTSMWTSVNGSTFDTEGTSVLHSGTLRHMLNTIRAVTSDWQIPAGQSVYEVLNNWESIVTRATEIDTGFIVLEHDLYQQTVDVATGYILPDALAHQPPFKIEPIISCIGRPLADAYAETNGTAPAANSSSTSTTGSSTNTGSGSASASETASSGAARSLPASLASSIVGMGVVIVAALML